MSDATLSHKKASISLVLGLLHIYLQPAGMMPL
jgi:hypothetical protein